MDFYERKRRAGLALARWIADDDRQSFSSFCRAMLGEYGFGSDSMRRMLEKEYPGLSIKDDKLNKEAE